MRVFLLMLALCTTSALASEPAESNAPVVAAADAPMQGEVRFRVGGMKPAGEGF